VISGATVWIDKERGRWVQVMPTGNIAGDLQPRLFFSSTTPPPSREAVRGYPFLPPLSQTTRKHSIVATTDRTIPGKQVLEMLPQNKKFWHRNHSYHRSLCTHNPVILLPLNILLWSAPLFKRVISWIQILSTNILVWYNVTDSPRSCRLTTDTFVAF